MGKPKSAGKPEEYVLRLTQLFQFAEGAIEAQGSRSKLEDVKLNGARLTFKAQLPNASPAGTYEFSARVNGDAMEGTYKAGPEQRAVAFKARRTGGKTAIGPEIDPKLKELKAVSGVQ